MLAFEREVSKLVLPPVRADAECPLALAIDPRPCEGSTRGRERCAKRASRAGGSAHSPSAQNPQTRPLPRVCARQRCGPEVAPVPAGHSSGGGRRRAARHVCRRCVRPRPFVGHSAPQTCSQCSYARAGVHRGHDQVSVNTRVGRRGREHTVQDKGAWLRSAHGSFVGLKKWWFRPAHGATKPERDSLTVL